MMKKAGGIVKSKLDQPQEAVADFDKAIELNPEYVEACLRMYTANAKLGKLKEATRDYNRAKELMGILGADFGGADLNFVKLKGVQADGASFAGTDLHGADLRNGRFARTDFTGANLAGANIKDANLSDSRMKKEKTALSLLAEEGWFFNPEIPVSILHEIEPRIRENPDKVWNWFDDFFRNHLDSIERRLTKSYPKRVRFFGGAFSAHRQGEYSLSIPVFLS